MEAVHQIHPEHVEYHADGGEHADLHHGDRVEQCAHGSRGDHRARQPVVQRHDGVLGEAQDAAHVEDDDDAVMDARRKNAGVGVGGEVERSGEDVDQHHRRENESLGRSGQIGQVLPAALVAFLVLVMGDQRVRGDADDLVEEIQREQIVGEGAPDGAEKRQCETGIEAGLRVLPEAAHIAGRIEHRDHPEKRRGDGKDHRQGVGAQRKAQAGQQLEERKMQRFPGAHAGNHRGDDQKERRGREERAGLAQIGLPAGQHDQAGAGKRCEDGEQEPDVGRGLHGAIHSIRKAPWCGWSGSSYRPR